MVLRWGLIGCGDIARRNVAPALRDLPNCELVAVSRASYEKAESFAREFGAKRWYERWQDLIADEEIDAGYVGTPVYLHAVQTIAAAEAGKHVLCEKPMAMVEGVEKLGRAKSFVGADGSFTNAMFEKRPDTIARRNIRWLWTENPFVGTKEFSGLVILNALLNNWDAKIDNNNVLGMYGEDKSTVYDWYIQSDWGGTFGKTGGVFSHSKWDLKEFSKQAFISNVSGGKVNLHYSGKMSSELKAVPIDHARWFAGILGQLSDKQLSEAFRAANATDVEAKGFVSRIRQKINELNSVASR